MNHFSTRYGGTAVLLHLIFAKSPAFLLAQAQPDYLAANPEHAAWFETIEKEKISPYFDQANPKRDFIKEWVGVDGEQRAVVVLKPRVHDANEVNEITVPLGKNAQQNAAAIHNALIRARKSKTVVQLPPGEFDIDTDRTNGPKHSHIFMHDLEDVVLRGDPEQKTKLRFTDFSIPAIDIFGKNQRVKVEHIHFSFDLKIAYPAKIVETFRTDGTLDKGFKFYGTRPQKTENFGALFAADLDTSDPEAIKLVNRAPKNAFVKYHFRGHKAGKTNATDFPIEKAGDTYFPKRRFILKSFPVGRNILVTPKRQGLRHPIQISGQDAHNISFENIDISQAPGVAFFAFGATGFHLHKVRLFPEKGRLVGGNAAFSRGFFGHSFVMTECHAQTMNDDGTNLASLDVPTKASSHRPKLMPDESFEWVLGSEKSMRRHDTKKNWIRYYKTGDLLALMDRDGHPIASFKLLQLPTKDRRWVIRTSAVIERFRKDIDLQNLQPGSHFINLELLSSGYYIANNRIENTVARGILVQSPNGLIENNTIRNTAMEGIQIRIHNDFYWETPGVVDLVLRNNKIENAQNFLKKNHQKLGGLAIFGGHKRLQDPIPVHKDIKISNTKITDSFPAVTIGDFLNVVVDGLEVKTKSSRQIEFQGYCQSFSLLNYTLNGKASFLAPKMCP